MSFTHHLAHFVPRNAPAAQGLLGVGALVLLPLLLQGMGLHWVRTADTCLLYVMLALGLNVVVGFAGLLDLGYIAFYALGAYGYALLASPHLSETFAAWNAWFPGGLHTPVLLVLPLAALGAALAGVLLGAPTLRLRGDYLAIVTLGFGEIVRILIINLNHPINLTEGAKGLGQIDAIRLGPVDFGQAASLWGFTLPSVTLYYYLLLALVLATVCVVHRLHRSRIGRAWIAIREDELAAQAMGIPVRNLKLWAFAIGSSFGGVAGVMFSAFQGFISPEAFSLQESVLIVAMVVFGGIGHIPGVIVGAVLLTALPEVLRYVVAPLEAWSNGHLAAGVVRPLLIATIMVLTMLVRPQGLWPAPSARAARENRLH